MNTFLLSIHYREKPLYWHVAIGCLLLSILQFFFHDPLLLVRSAILQGEYWRVVTGNFVHTNTNHLLMNLSGLAILALLFNNILKLRLFYLSLVLISIAVGLGVTLHSTLSWYAGLSGMLYGLFMVAAAVAFIKGDLLLSLPLLFFIPAKLILDSYQPSLTHSSASLIGAPVATVAHLYGVLAGLVISIIVLLFRPKYLV